VTVLLVFTLSRIGYYVAGVRFDTSPLSWFWQFVDPDLLRAGFVQSIWYLHSQPPAFNFFLGIVINLFPNHEIAVFAICYLLLGLVFSVTLLQVLRGFRVSDAISAVAVSAYVASPAVVLYENWLFYAYPATVLLLLAALFWQRFVQDGRFHDALLVFVCASLLALTWSLFHVVWLFGLASVLLLLRRREWRKVLAAATVPMLIVVFWYGKNLVQFGQFTGSTWFGVNFSRMTTRMLTMSEWHSLLSNGAVSAVSLIEPFSDLTRYGTVPKAAPTGIPVLDQELKSGGSPNFNNATFITVSRIYGRDAVRTLAHCPAAYVRGLVESYLVCFLPASTNQFLERNAARIRPFDRCACLFLDGQFGYHPSRGRGMGWLPFYSYKALAHPGWVLVLAYTSLLAVGPFLLFRRRSTVPQRAELFFLWFNVAWMTIAANALEVGENNRFRFTADPLVFVFFLTVATLFVRYSLNARQRRTIGTREPVNQES